MAQIRRATIAADVGDEVSTWLTQAHAYMLKDDWTFKKLSRDAEKLASADPYQSSILRAMVWHATGDLGEALRWIDNARKWPNHGVTTREVELLILSNLGYFSRSAEALTLYDPLPLNDALSSFALLTCSFAYLSSKASAPSAPASDRWRTANQQCERCAMALKDIGVSESQARAVLDIAGEVLRSRQFFFAGTEPLIRPIHDGLLYQLRVQVDASTASALTDEVISRMVERNLDAPGLAFSFIPA